MKLKDLKSILDNMTLTELEQLAVVKDETGHTYTVKGIETKEVDYFYDRTNELALCYTELQMKQMNIPKEYWQHDHVASSSIIKIESL